MCRGIPGSGKSFWAKEYKDSRSNEQWVIVNKDDIRLELTVGGWSWTPENEKTVVAIRDARIVSALEAGKSVISTDTNFGTKHEPRLRELALLHNALFMIRDFTHVPLEECIRRDSLRATGFRIGPKVITELFYKWVYPPQKKYEPEEDAPYAVICDMDGTLALSNGLRGVYQHEKCADDNLCQPVYDLLALFVEKGYTILYMTGRQDKYRPETEQFLHKHKCPLGPLFMRQTNDPRRDTVVKKELFDNHVRNVYNVKFVLEDRLGVIKMWQDLGLFTLSVGPLKDF